MPRNIYPTAIPTSAVLKRKTVNTYYYPTPVATDWTTDSSNQYANPSSPALKKLIKSTEVQDGSGTPVSRTEFFYDGGGSSPDKGNLTETRTWDSFKGGASRAYSNPLTSTNSLSTFAAYDSYSNVTSATDANGNVTQMTYGNVTGPSGNVAGLFPTQTVAAYGTSIARTSTATYDFYTGQSLTTTDVDNSLTNAVEYDQRDNHICL